MEDLWKLKDLSYRLENLADRAEYDRLVKRFHEEEERLNTENLLYRRPAETVTKKEKEST